MSAEQVVRTEKIAIQVHRTLRQRILSGQIGEGERLVETTLAKDLAVSRTPVREAIKKLESEGLVEFLPHGGVAAIDVRVEMLDRYGLRACIEGYAARLAAERRTDDEVSRMRELVNLTITGYEESAQVRSDLHNQLHDLIVRAARYRQIGPARESLLGALMDDRGIDQDRRQQIAHEHDDIIDAIDRQDGKSAEVAMRSHVLGLASVESAMWEAADRNST